MYTRFQTLFTRVDPFLPWYTRLYLGHVKVEVELLGRREVWAAGGTRGRVFSGIARV